MHEHALLQGIAFGFSRTVAGRSMKERCAFGVLAADVGVVARVSTAIVEAFSGRRAIAVGKAVSWIPAACLEGISNLPVWAYARKTTVSILTSVTQNETLNS